jgi:hypothetical protein
MYDEFALPAPSRVIRHTRQDNIASSIYKALPEMAPDIVLLYGDLDATLHAAFACVERGLPTIHVESGYRSRDPDDPEEKARVLVDHCATHRIAFSSAMRSNLTDEGIPENTISIFGNPALQTLSSRLASDRVPVEDDASGLVLIHHDENLVSAQHLELILERIEQLANKFPLTIVVYQGLRRRLQRHRLIGRLEAIVDAQVVPALKYSDFVERLLRVSFVVTDCISVNVECSFLRKPCFVLRRATPLRGPNPQSVLVENLSQADLGSMIADLMTAGPAPRVVDLEQLAPHTMSRSWSCFLRLLERDRGSPHRVHSRADHLPCGCRPPLRHREIREACMASTGAKILDRVQEGSCHNDN